MIFVFTDRNKFYAVIDGSVP